MKIWTKRAVALAVLAASAGPLTAQESDKLVATMTDWSVFVEEAPSKECWGVSALQQTAIRHHQGHLPPRPHPQPQAG